MVERRFSNSGNVCRQSSEKEPDVCPIGTIGSIMYRRMFDRLSWSSIVVGVLLSLVVSYEIATLSFRLGSLAWGWTYSYGAKFTWRPIGAALLVSGFSAALLFLAGPAFVRPEAESTKGQGALAASRRNRWLLVVAWIALATPLQGLVRSLTPSDFESIFVSDAANSFYRVTQEYGARQVLSDFDDIRNSWPLHAQSNMPGKLIFVYVIQLFSTNTEILPWMVVAISNLGGMLVYTFARDLFNDGRVAIASVILYLFAPGKLLFFPLLNTVTPVLVFGCGCLLLRMLQTKRPRYAGLLGAAVYGVAFFEPLPLVVGLLFAALLLRALWLGTISARELAERLAVGCVGFATVYAAMFLWFGFDLVDAFRRIGTHAVEFNLQNARPYRVWLVENLRELTFGMGVCQAVVFFAALAHGLRGADNWRTRLSRPITALCLGLLAVVAVTDLIGVNRGEVTRLWIFLACMLQLPTAYVCARLESNAAILAVVSCTVLQASLGTAMIAFLITGKLRLARRHRPQEKLRSVPFRFHHALRLPITNGELVRDNARTWTQLTLQLRFQLAVDPNGQVKRHDCRTRDVRGEQITLDEFDLVQQTCVLCHLP